MFRDQSFFARSRNRKNVWIRKLSISFVSLGNRTQEADGSIPFISTPSLGIFSLHGVCKTFRPAVFRGTAL
jgi:hypothetical protein